MDEKKKIIEIETSNIRKYLHLAAAGTFTALSLTAYLTCKSFDKKSVGKKGEIVYMNDLNLENVDFYSKGLEKIVRKGKVSTKWGKGRLISKEEAYSYINSVYENYSIAPEITPDFVHAILYRESAYNPDAVSHAKARGLMQIMPSVWRSICKDYSFEKYSTDPVKNVEVGIKHLNGIRNYLKAENNNWDKLSNERKLSLISAAYNGGAARLKKRGWSISKMPRETREYVKFVLNKV